MGNNIIVGISEMKFSNKKGDKLVTYSLGSCLGVAIYDPVARVGGLIHCMLPLSKVSPDKAKNNPSMFVDTGTPLLFQEAYRLGARKDRLIVKIAGCSQLLDNKGIFKIGKRNYTVFRKLLWKNNIIINSEHVGESLSRTMFLEVTTGRVSLKIKGQEVEL